MKNGLKKTGRYDVEEVKRRAFGRWPEIISRLTGVDQEILNGKKHPCPKCGGKDRFNLCREGTGAAYCNQCPDGPKVSTSGIYTVAWLNSEGFRDSIVKIAEYIGIEEDKSSTRKIKALNFLRWNESQVKLWLLKKPGIKIESLALVGAKLADYINKYRVIAFPVWSKDQSNVTGWIIYRTDGGLLPTGTSRPRRRERMLLVDYTSPGVVGYLNPNSKIAYKTEGTTDLLALLSMAGDGVSAFTNSSGTMQNPGKEFDWLTPKIDGKEIRVLHDCDQPGQRGAEKWENWISRNCQKSTVKNILLPYSLIDSKGKDIRDWINEGGNITEFERICQQSNEAVKKPSVSLEQGEYEVAEAVIDTLGKLKKPHQIFSRGSSLVQVISNDANDLSDQYLKAALLPASILRERIGQACDLIKGGNISTPPLWLVNAIKERGHWGRKIKILSSIVESPTIRPDGSVIQNHGYDQSTGLFFCPNSCFPKVSENPTIEDAKNAANDLLEVVQDFPFHEEIDRSGWLAMVLTMIGRTAIKGCCPMFAVSATTAGSGKTKLADLANIISTGRPIPKKSFPKNDAEMGKIITSVAIEAISSMLLDNIDQTLGGASLDACLTATSWSDRVLGTNTTTGSLPMRTIWVATGNNLKFGSDIARRVIPIKLSAMVENPEEREDFKVEDIISWTTENRPRLAIAALTILRAYFVAGCPKQPGGQFGSFENWSAVIRGSIVWCGLADPLKTRESAKADDTSGAILRGLIGGLIEVDQTGDGMTVREIVNALNDPANTNRFPSMREAVSEVATVRGSVDQKKLGYSFRKYRGRIANGYRLMSGDSHGGVKKWKIQPVETTTPNGGDGGDGGDDFIPSEIDCENKKFLQDKKEEKKFLFDDEIVDGIKPSQPSPPSQPAEFLDEVEI